MYLTILGSYGLIWTLKDIIFPDKRLDRESSWGSFAIHFLYCTIQYTVPAYWNIEARYEHHP